MSNDAQLTVRFPPVAMMLAVSELTVTFDGGEIFHGNFVTGFEVAFPVASGAHEIVTRIGVGPLERRKVIPIEIVPGTTVVTLKYSRFWGNFTKKPAVVRA